MSRIIFIICFYVVFFFLGKNIACAGQNDFVFQPGLMLEKKLSRSFALRLYSQAFQNQNLSENASYFSELSLQYKINNRLSLNAGIREGNYRSRSNIYDDRQLYSMAVNYNRSKNNWSYSLRGRFQRLYFGDFDPDNYRNPRSYFRYRLTVKKRINYYFSPFAEYEAFQPLNIPTRKGIDQHRVSAGLSYTVNDRLKFEGYYQIMKLTKRSHNNTNFILGINSIIRL